jgi:hypothetical protein
MAGGYADAQQELRMCVQVAWEKAMDVFYENLDRIPRDNDDDVLGAVRTQIDEETADAYQEWIDA